MQVISATDLARNTRQIIDSVANGGGAVVVERNQVRVATITSAEPVMTGRQVLEGLRFPLLTAAQGAAWLKDSRADFGNDVKDPWAS